MWRFVVAAALLIVLVVLVAEMLFGKGDRLGTVDRYPPPPTWHGLSQDARATNDPPVIALNRLATASGWVDIGPPTGSALEPPSPPGMAIQLDAWQARHPFKGNREPWPGEVPPPSEPQPGQNTEAQPVVNRAQGEAQPVPAQAVAARPARSQVVDAQQQLAALGYAPGLTDGRSGRRTVAAVRKFQRDIHQPETGRIDTLLLAQLETERRMRTHLRQQELEAMSPDPAPSPELPEAERGIFGTILGGVQRLMGRNFDSVHRPDEITSYCRSNADSWIYDFGREAFIYCGNVRAGETVSAGAESASADSSDSR